jgi:hypothetical protein
MSDITLPIIVVEGADVAFYASVDAAERDLEAIDVKRGEYRVYDAEGRVLDLEVQSSGKSGLASLLVPNVESVCVRVLDDLPSRPDELRRSLIEFLSCSRAGRVVELQSWSLAELVRSAMQVSGLIP